MQKCIFCCTSDVDLSKWRAVIFLFFSKFKQTLLYVGLAGALGIISSVNQRLWTWAGLEGLQNWVLSQPKCSDMTENWNHHSFPSQFPGLLHSFPLLNSLFLNVWEGSFLLPVSNTVQRSQFYPQIILYCLQVCIVLHNTRTLSGPKTNEFIISFG